MNLNSFLQSLIRIFKRKKIIKNLKARVSSKKALLTWEIIDTRRCEYVELLCKSQNSKEYKRVDIVPVSKSWYEFEPLPFVKYEFLLNPLSKDKSLIDGASEKIELTGKHETVILKEVSGRKLQIYIPPSYKKDNTRRYPVIYMNDGQNLFVDSTSFCGAWHVDTVAEQLAKKGLIQEVVIVGIYNTRYRSKEYLPYYDKEVGVVPSAKEYLSFVVDKIIPYIEANFPVLAGRENRAIGGSSFGGINAMWAGYEFSDYFSHVIAMSPSLWVANGQIFHDIKNIPKKDITLWFDIGTLEWNDYTVLIDILNEKGYNYGKDFFYYEDKNGIHNEVHWGKRFKFPLIMFAGGDDYTPREMKVEFEILPDRHGKVLFKLNPVLKCVNQIEYSVGKFASYRSIKPKRLKIDKNGFFIPAHTDMIFEVSYKKFNQIFKLSQNQIILEMEKLFTLKKVK